MNTFKKKVTMFTTMLAFLTVSCAAVNAAGIADNTVMGKTGNMDIGKSGSRMDVNLTSRKSGDVGQVDWRNFNVGKGERVNFGFSNNSQTVINRVLGGQESKIMGQLTNSCTTGSCAANAATSKVILINPAGIMFGAGSQVDLNSFTASTFDFRGAKNLQNMSQAAIDAYQAGTLDKMSPTAAVNGTGLNKGYINFDSNYTQAFKDAGIDMSKFQGKTQINLDGTKFGHFNTDANGNLLDSFADSNPNKSVNIVSDNITYKDSLIRTGGNNNYRVDSANYTASNSNVRLITADGVTFGYVANGYSDGYEETANDTKTDVVRNIVMDNSGLDRNTPAIESGDVKIKNVSNAKGSDIKIKETYVKADKLFNMTRNGQTDASSGGEHGNVTILGTGNVDIENSQFESVNTELNGKTTASQAGGEIKISGVGDVNVKNTLIKSAGVDKSKYNDTYYTQMHGGNTSGQVNVESVSNNVNIEGTRILSQEDASVSAGKNISFDNSLIQAKSSIDNGFKDVSFNSKNQINIHNGAISADNIDLDATASGKVKISSDSNSTNFSSGNVLYGQDKSLLKAQKDININAGDTEINNSSLAYNNLNLVNDVTVKGNVTLTPNSGKDLTIQTNGNLTFDNADVMYGEKAEVNVNSNDSYQVNVKGSKANNLTGKSTDKDVTIKNGSDLKASKNINLASDKGSVSVNKSKLTSGNNTNINAKTTSDIDGSTINATGDANIKAGSSSKINESTVKGKNINVDAGTTSDVMNSTLDAGNNATIASKGANTVNKSTINAKTGNASVTSTNADTTINDSTVEAGNHVTAKGKNVNVTKSNIIAGSDSDGFDKVNDANDTIGDANIIATDGSVHISGSKVESQDHDVNITSHDTIAFGTGKNITPDVQIKGTNNVNIKSTAGDITAERTDMGDIEYGNRLTFDAAGDNIFTSADSLKSVNVDFKAGGANRIYTTDDAQFVNSTFEAPNNFVEAGGDVILNNHEIKSATPNAKDTKTQIFANGNVTTDNVTGEDLNAKGGTFPQTTEYNGSAFGPQGSNTVLNVNQTKLTVETQTVKDAANPDNGSIKLDVQNADNPNAGLDLVAKNVDKLDKDPTGGYNKPGYFKSGESKWDENINPKEGPEVHLNATDNKVSIANIETDKLSLDPNDKKIADTTKGTPKIEVKDQGGFNLDPELDYNPDKTGNGYTYDENYNVKDKTVTGGDLTMDDWTDWKTVSEETKPDGTKVTTEERTRDGEVSDKITTQTEQEHKITFDNNGEPSEFTLVYDKKDTTVDPGYKITAEDVKSGTTQLPDIVNPETGEPVTPDDFVETRTSECPPAPVIDPEPNAPANISADSLINQIKLPREQLETSKTSKIVDNTVDQSDNVMSAAAKVDVSEDGENSYDEDEEIEE